MQQRKGDNLMSEQTFKLGDKVKFSKSLKNTEKSGFPNDVKYLSEQELQNFEEEVVINVVFKAPVEHKEMTGIVVGKRRISTNTDFELCQEYHPYEEDRQFISVSHNFETVYLVACNLVGFKRVLPSDLEVVE